jgi:GMP synthase (glutamine-hydrolysing)
MKKITIIKTGDTRPAIQEEFGDFEDWICRNMGVEKQKARIVDVPRGDILPDAKDCKNIVIAGSYAMVTQNLAWSVAIEKWIPGLIASGVPILGICYGHQLLCKAMGGVVGYHDKGVEVGTVDVQIVSDVSNDRLFQNLPGTFKVHASHSQTVLKLPETAVKIAENDFEPNHAFRIGDSAWGVQFHPEYDERIMASDTMNMAGTIEKSGLVLSEILENIKSTPIALEILRRFGELTG